MVAACFQFTFIRYTGSLAFKRTITNSDLNTKLISTTNMSTTKINKEEREENLLSVLLFRFLPYWPLFLLSAIICVALAWTYLQFATPLYDASATILLKDEKKGVDDGKMIDVLDQYTGNKIVENEIEVLQSRTLMKEVVN